MVAGWFGHRWFAMSARTTADRVRVRPRFSETGFTLLEVLVALTVLAIGVALAISLISGSLGNIRKVEKRTRIVDHAASVMELALIDKAIQGPTSFNGDFADGTRWIVRVEEYTSGDAGLQPPQNMQAKLLAYTVEMSHPHSSSVDYRLQTLKLVSTQEAGQLQSTTVR